MMHRVSGVLCPPPVPALPVTLRGPQLPSPSVISSSQEGEGQGLTIEAQDLWVSGGHASGGPLGWSTGFLSSSCHWSSRQPASGARAVPWPRPCCPGGRQLQAER